MEKEKAHHFAGFFMLIAALQSIGHLYLLTYPRKSTF